MWETETIDAGRQPACLQPRGSSLYWLARDENVEPLTDKFGRERPMRRLVCYDLEAETTRELADGLPPSNTLAVCEDAAYTWSADRSELVRVDFSGGFETAATLDVVAEGGLRGAGSTLFYAGELAPKVMGIAVYRPEEQQFVRVLDTDDPTHVALQLVHVEPETIWRLVHDARGWVLESRDLEGTVDIEEVITEEKLMLRWLSRTAAGFLIGGDQGVYLYDSEDGLEQVAHTDVPPDDVTEAAGHAAWVLSAITDQNGDFAEPWRVQAAPLSEAGQPSVIHETTNRIARLVGSEWGCAFFAQDTSGGLDSLLNGHPDANLVVLRAEQ